MEISLEAELKLLHSWLTPGTGAELFRKYFPRRFWVRVAISRKRLLRLFFKPSLPRSWGSWWR